MTTRDPVHKTDPGLGEAATDPSMPAELAQNPAPAPQTGPAGKGASTARGTGPDRKVRIQSSGSLPVEERGALAYEGKSHKPPKPHLTPPPEASIQINVTPVGPPVKLRQPGEDAPPSSLDEPLGPTAEMALHMDRSPRSTFRHLVEQLDAEAGRKDITLVPSDKARDFVVWAAVGMVVALIGVFAVLAITRLTSEPAAAPPPGVVESPQVPARAPTAALTSAQVAPPQPPPPVAPPPQTAAPQTAAPPPPSPATARAPTPPPPATPQPATANQASPQPLPPRPPPPKNDIPSSAFE